MKLVVNTKHGLRVHPVVAKALLWVIAFLVLVTLWHFIIVPAAATIGWHKFLLNLAPLLGAILVIALGLFVMWLIESVGTDPSDIKTKTDE